MPAWAPPVRPQDVVGTGHKWLEPVDQEGVHKGVDLQLTKGKPALSPVDGVVSDVGNDPQGLGITVTIRDAQGTETKLGHLDGVHVKVGDHVKQGQQVADVGSTGASTGSHLDVRMQDKDGQYQDPTAMLGALAQMPRADQPAAVGAGQEDDAGNPIGWAAAMEPGPGESWGGYGTDPRYGEFAQGGQPGHWNDLPPAMPWGGVPSWLRELSLRYNIPPEMIGPDFIQQLMPIPPHNQSPWWTPDYPGEGQDRASVGVGQGSGRGFTPPLPAGGVYGAQKWSSPMGSNAVDIFVRRGTPVVAPTSGTLQQGMNGQLILVGDQGTSFAFRHGQTTASGHVQEGQAIGYVNDPGLDSLGRAPWGNMPDNYQHLEMSVSQGSPSFPATPGGGGNVDAAQWLNSIGYSGNEISKTPGPPDAGGGGGFGGFGGQQGFGGMPGMPGGMGGSPFGGMGMGMPGMGFPGMPGGLGMMGGSPFGMGMGMPGMPGGMGQQMGMTSPMGMGMPGGAGMFGDPSMGGGFGGMDQGMGMSTGMGAMDPMAMGAGPMGDFSGGGGGGGGASPDMSSMFGGMGGFGGGGFGGMGGGGFGGGGFGGGGGGFGQPGMGGGQQFGGGGGLGSQMQTPAFSGYPGAMPSGGSFGGPTGNPVTMTAADNLMQQELAWKPDWTGVNAAQDQLKKNATAPLGAIPINTHQLPGAPQSTLKPWDWLNQIYPGSGQDRAPVGSGQDRPRWDVGVGQSVTPTNSPFTGTLTTDPGQAVSGNLNQQYFQLAQQQLQQQIQQVNQQFNQQQQQLAQQASQFGMTTQLAQQQQELQQKQFDANQQLQRQLAELQNAQLQQNLGIQVGQFNQQMGLQGAQLGLQAGQFNQQMGLNAAQLGLQQQQLGMLPQQLAAQYGLSAAQLGQGQQQMGIQVQQLNQQYQQAQQAAYQSYLTSGNQDQYQRELANMNAKFQQAQAQIQQAQYGGTMQLQQQQLRGQTGLSLAQMAQQQQQAGFGRQMDIFNSAMANPWLQQLSGMAPQWGAAGGPQEAGQAAAAGMPNMPSQGGGINLPDLMQYFPDINVQQYLQGQTPQMGPSPFQNNWQSVMSGLGQYSPYNQSQITMPENPFPFQVPQFSVGQNPYPFNFQPVSSSFNPQALTVPPEGQMPWGTNPGPPDPSTTNPPGSNNGYQAGPLTFTGQGSMGTPPTGYNGGGSTYTLPNGQTFTSQDVWNWEQSNQGSSPDQAYQYEMGQHGFPGWNFPIGNNGGFPVGSTVGWNMGAGASPTTPPTGSGQDRWVGAGQDDLRAGMAQYRDPPDPNPSTDLGTWTDNPYDRPLYPQENWQRGGPPHLTQDWTRPVAPRTGAVAGPYPLSEEVWQALRAVDPTARQLSPNMSRDQLQEFFRWRFGPTYGPGTVDENMRDWYQNEWPTYIRMQAPAPEGSGQDVGAGEDMSWLSGGTNPLMQGDPTGWGMGAQQGNMGSWGGDFGGGWAQPTAIADPMDGGATRPSGGNTTGDAYQQWQQAMGQWQQQEQAYQQYGQQETSWKNNWDQFYGNWRQNFGQPGYDVSGLAQWRQTNPEPTAVQDPGAAPTAPLVQPPQPNPPVNSFWQWLTNQAHQPYQAPAAPQIPHFQNFSGMDPFQQAGLQTQARLSGIAWPQYQNQMRQEWGQEGVTQPQIQSPLSMANLQNNTLNNLSWDNVLSVFGQTPQQYNTTYSPYWSQAQASGVNGIMGGGY